MLPPLYHIMCIGPLVPEEESSNARRSRLFHCNKLRKILSDAIIGLHPSEVDVHRHINELGELNGDHTFLEISKAQRSAYGRLVSMAKGLWYFNEPIGARSN